MDPLDSSESRLVESANAAENTESSLPWARFSSWLECVCVVTFDLELGQAIEVLWVAMYCTVASLAGVVDIRSS